MGRVGLDLDHLIDDFPGGQVAAKTHAARRAELAGHRTTDLATDADHVLGIFRAVQQRDADGFKGIRPLAAEEILGESVLRRNDLVDERQMRNGRPLPDPIEDAAGYAGHEGRIFALADRGHLQ